MRSSFGRAGSRRVARWLVWAVLTIGCITAPPARAAGLILGVDSNGPLTPANPSVSASWAARLSSIGATLMRVDVLWSAVAPTALPQDFQASDPGSRYYSWTSTDALVRTLTAHGLSIVMQLGSAPRWAEGANRPSTAAPGTWDPSAGAFGQFAHAAAIRYSGHYPDPLRPGAFLPRVHLWEAWNEPNLSEDLAPQWIRIAGHYIARAPTIYRHLLNAFYAGVKSVSGKNLVLAGATAPFGDLSPSLSYATARIPPVTFVREMLCLGKREPCGNPAHLDILDHHPYEIGGPLQHALNPPDVSIPDMGKLTRLLRAARRAGTVVPRRTERLWVTEIGWSSRPPDPYGVPLMRHARWLEQGLYVLWRQGVSAVCWLLAEDPPGSPKTNFDAGMFFSDGRPKPAVTAFRFPFVAARQDASTIRVWGRAPATGIVLIQRLSSRHWHTLKRLKTSEHAVFFVPLSLRGRALLRAREGAVLGLTWPTS